MTDLAHLRDIWRDFEADRKAGGRLFKVGGYPDDPAIVQTATTTLPEREAVTFRALVAALWREVDRLQGNAEALASRLAASEERWREEAALRADLQKLVAKEAA